MELNQVLKQQYVPTSEFYSQVIDSLQDYSIFTLDNDLHINSWNSGSAKIFQYETEEIIGKHFSTFYLEHDKQAKKPERELALARQFGKVEDEDWRKRKDGSKFWASVVITALYNPAGELVGFGKVTRDLTKRKQHEDELHQANILLKRQQRDLERLNVSKDEFISLASHQLRTPATGVKQYLGLVLEGFMGDPGPQLTEVIQKAYDSNEHQLTVVNNLLRVAQLDSGKVVLHKSATDIRKLLQEIVDGFADGFQKRQQTARVMALASLPKLAVDPGYLRMALENLVDNASKYTPDRGVITVTAQATHDGLTITIKDTGVGVAPADADKLFKKFSRIPNALSNNVSGSGLGLYWVQRIIALHGGTIAVESAINKGTTFTMFLPLDSLDA